MADRFSRYQLTLLRLEKSHRKRELISPRGIDFTSNDYLGLANASRIKQAIITAIEQGISIGAGGSRLLRGHHEAFEALESDAANFFNSERILYFNSGYTANIALFSTLPQRDDLILYDERVHASIRDGIASSRAQSIVVSHNDVEAFSSKIQTWRKAGGKGRPWIAVESLYSMDGDRAPLAELFSLAHHHEGFLVLDEAHATGVFGQAGKGLASFYKNQDHVIVLHTCGKALGVSGALLCVNKIFYEYLINRARSFIYSTAPSPLIAVGVGEALKILREEPCHRERLESLYQFANQQMKMLLNREGSGSQILPIVIGNNEKTVRLAQRLQQLGYDIRAIRPPTVPEKTARLRISITLHVSEKDIEQMLAQLSQLMQEE